MNLLDTLRLLFTWRRSTCSAEQEYKSIGSRVIRVEHKFLFAILLDVNLDTQLSDFFPRTPHAEGWLGLALHNRSEA